MKIKIKRIDKSLPLPSYQTAGSVAFDFVARKDTIIEPKTTNYVPLNVCIKTPKGYMLLLSARSSLHKRGLMLANGIGVGDQDFCGDSDEYQAALYNFIDQPVKVKRGDRVVQGKLVPIEKCKWLEVDSMETNGRGGFGSTG